MSQRDVQNKVYSLISLTYVGYPESKFRWAVKKKQDLLQTMYISIWCTHLTLHFNIVSTIAEALFIALHQFLYPSCIRLYVGTTALAFIIK
jgi:hypothetical protein